jgi:hypothetical protein
MNTSEAIAAVAQIGNCVRLVGKISEIVQRSLGDAQRALRDLNPNDPDAAELRLFLEQAEQFAGQVQCAALFTPDCGPALRRLLDARAPTHAAAKG